MIVHVEKEIQKTKDKALKMLLQYILEEEKKHHKMLETIIKHTQHKIQTFRSAAGRT